MSSTAFSGITYQVSSLVSSQAPGGHTATITAIQQRLSSTLVAAVSARDSSPVSDTIPSSSL
jgi:hypothetical protein